MSSLTVPSPASLAVPIHVPLKTLSGPGPSNVSERVLQVKILQNYHQVTMAMVYMAGLIQGHRLIPNSQVWVSVF